MKECLRRLNVKAALNACAKKAVSIRQEAAWQLHSRMRQACSSRLHARNCFQSGGFNPQISRVKGFVKDNRPTPRNGLNPQPAG